MQTIKYITNREPPEGFQKSEHYSLRVNEKTQRPEALNDNDEWIPLAACYNNSWVGSAGVLFFYILKDFNVNDLNVENDSMMTWFNLSPDCEAYNYGGKLYYELTILGGKIRNPNW